MIICQCWCNLSNKVTEPQIEHDNTQLMRLFIDFNELKRYTNVNLLLLMG